MNRPPRIAMLAAVVLATALQRPFANKVGEPYSSNGRSADPTVKVIAEIRASEKRRIPLEVALKTSNRYETGGPVEVTVMVTNLFDAPLLLNSRMLVNHPRLQGELSFVILGPDGKRCEIQRLVTPLSLRDEDFVLLPRGQSIQRTVDLSDFFAMSQKGSYRVLVSYRNDVDRPIGENRAWKGAATSEVTEFELN